MPAKKTMELPTFDDLKKNVVRRPVRTDAKMKIGKIDAVDAPKKQRVAVYARVSTEMDGQDSSYDIQQTHYENEIAKHPGWELVGIYHERVSGTHMENRIQLGMLLEECEKHRVDIILTKSISRFARSTTDLLTMVRRITACGVRIIFEKEHVDTASSDGEMILSILASFAEAESRSISDNNKWSIRKRFENGTYRYAKAPYGYDLEDGAFFVNPKEAAIVKEIFTRFLSGEGSTTIANDLNRRHIRLKREDENWVKTEHDGEWDAGDICRILRNETYLGDSVLQKSYHDEHFVVRMNQGELPMYFWEGHHEAIADPETFERVQKLLSQRRKEAGEPAARKASVFRGKVICAKCGTMLHRDIVKLAQEERVWWRRGKHKSENCNRKAVLEDDIKNAFVTMLNKLHYADMVLDLYIDRIEKEWKEHHEERLAELEEKIKKNEEELDRLAVSMGTSHLNGGAASFLEKKNALLMEGTTLWYEYEALRQPAADAARALRDFVREWHGGMFPEDVFYEFVDKVAVEERDVFTFYFKCGLVLTE